jgi:DNA-binding transcriptional ArsR family regulator
MQSNAAFRALADQTRRDILELLRSGPRTSGEIAARFHSSWPTVSRHLAILREADLVRAERHGQEIHYELHTSVFQDFIQHLLEWMPAPPTEKRRARPGRRVQRPQEG